MSTEPERRCAGCGALSNAGVLFCNQCGGTRFVWVPPPGLLDPLIICTRCGRQIDAGKAWHSRETGKAICGSCKQQEMRQS